jgi:hypothetical protein
VVKLWFISPTIWEHLLNSNGRFTLPYLENIDNALAFRLQQIKDPHYTFEGMHSGIEWLKVLAETKEVWKPRLKSNLKGIMSCLTLENVFVHLLIFSDAFQTSRQRRNKGHEVIFMSCAEFEDKHRWEHIEYASVAPLVVYHKSNRSKMGRNDVLKLFTGGFQRLSEGIDVGRWRVF